MNDSPSPSSPSHPIATEFIDTGAMCFEVDTCGDPESKKLALCLHGFPELSYSWRYQLPVLAGHGYKVWAPNQRGYGRTTRPPGIASYTMEHLLDDVASLIDASGCDSVTLLGHDWGGAVAWAAALTEIRPIERLVVMNLPHPALFAEHLRSWQQLRRSWYVFFMQLPWLPERLLTAGGARAVGEAFRGSAIDKTRFGDDVLDVYRRAALAPGAMRAMLNWYRAGFRSGLRRDSVMRRLRERSVLETPTLMLWGEEDIALGKDLTVGTDELVENLTLRFLPGVSHWVQQEAPEAVNAMLDAWLKDEPVPEAGWGGRLRPALAAEAGGGVVRPARHRGSREPQLAQHLRNEADAPLSVVELVRYSDPERGRTEHRIELAKLGGRLVFAARVDSLFIGENVTGDDETWDDVLISEYPTRWHLLSRLEADPDAPSNTLRARRLLCGRPPSRLARAGAAASFWAMRRFGGAAPIPWASPETVIEHLAQRAGRAGLDPSAAQVLEFAKTPLETPVVMLNLLTYRPLAEYAEGQTPVGRAAATGRDAYREYGRGVARLIAKSGGRIRFMGAGGRDFDAQEGGHHFAERGESWQEIVAVEYPSRRAFLSMVASPAYAQHSPHRDAGLARTQLFACEAWPEFR